jgi:hypothetical protein
LADGLDYVANGVLALSPLLLVIFLVAHRHGRGRDDILRAGSVALLAWIAYLVLIGGDIFPGYRHFTPVLAILFVMLLHTLSREPAFDPIGWTRRLRIPPVVFMMAVVAGFAGLQFAMPAHQRAKAERWEWDCRALADVLRDRYGGRDPVIAVTAAGCLPYWTGFPSIDLLGLNDLELPNRPPEDFGSGYLGHELGNLDYLLERKPDIVVFHVGDRPNFAYRRQIAADTRFERAYCPVTVDVRQIGTRLVYLRRDFAEEVAEDGACPAS